MGGSVSPHSSTNQNVKKSSDDSIRRVPTLSYQSRRVALIWITAKASLWFSS